MSSFRRRIFLNQNYCIIIPISLKFVGDDLGDNKKNIGLGNGLAPHKKQASNADAYIRQSSLQ